MRFNGKKVVVTGSAGAIGGAIANAFKVEGAILGLVDLKSSQVSHDLTSGGRHFEALADVVDRSALRAAITGAISHMGGVDILVNAAGVTSFGSAGEMSEAEWDRVIDINLKGVFFSCQTVIQPMLSQATGGRIVNIGSLLGKNGGNARPWVDPTEQKGSGNIAYGVSKAGVHALTIYLAKELAAAGITVNAVAPGPIVSAMTNKFPERLRASIPVGRMGQPTEVAAATLFLASDDAAFITGEVLDINGGAWCD
jgi:3-oxoacyl-[acyl-carrier protein] reductase